MLDGLGALMCVDHMQHSESDCLERIAAETGVLVM
jgi:hypothetical protein